MGLLRILLAISVVVVHSAQGRLFGIEFVGGQAAVQAFYVISGFYMALVLNRKYLAGREGYQTFILARLFRLFPAYLFVLGLTILLAATNLVHHPALDRWREQADRMSLPTMALYAGSQVTLIGQDAVWFTEYDEATGEARFAPSAHHAESPAQQAALLQPDARTPTPAIPSAVRAGMEFLFVAQAWTLAVELLFYVIAPFVVRRLGAIGVLFVLSWAVRLVLYQFGYRDSPWSYRFFPSELAMFLMGSAGYHFYAWCERRHPELLRRGGLLALPAMVGVILFLFQFSVPLRALIVAGATAVSVPFVFGLTKKSRVDRWIGELSYPVYISHELIRLALIHYTGRADVLWMVLLTLVASVAIMLLIEWPVERLRAEFVQRCRRRPSSGAPIASAPSVVGSGTV